MYIVHGTWIPRATDEFVQSGEFHVWVETGSARNTAPGYAVKYLQEQELATVLADEWAFVQADGKMARRRLRPCYLRLPVGSDGKCLPSPELARWLGIEPLEDHGITLSDTLISAYPLVNILWELADLHFLGTYQREDVQLGQDLLFWMHYGQALKQVLNKDHYIPALKYRELTGKGTTGYEIYPGWEILSSDYEQRVQQAVQQMPWACTAASFEPSEGFFDKASLLRHFGACVLFQLTTRTRIPTTFEQKIRGSLLDDCRRPSQAREYGHTAQALKRYQQWQAWRQALTPHGEGMQLGFKLLEGADERAPWQLGFVAVARNDPSLKLHLDDYWGLDGKARKALLKSFGADFEQRLLLDLGYAARMYPKIWQGLQTERPVGLTLSLEEAFAFLKEDAWVLEDAGFKVIVPAWWTPEGRQRARLRLKASSTPSGAGKAAGPGYFSLDALVKYRYELAIGEQTISPEEWRQLVEAKTPLVQFRGEWVELERDKMQRMLEFWQKHGQQDAELSLGELLHKAAVAEDEIDVSQNRALAEILAKLQQPARCEPIADPPEIRGTLRDYQKRGAAWLQYLENLGLNGCLADDMGLGKTLQVIARLVTSRETTKQPTLLIAPTSVLGGWQKEIDRFAPQLKVLIHHGTGRHQQAATFKKHCAEQDIVITSYTLARKDAALLQSLAWRRIVIDEAQNIKNPKTAQTKAILKFKAEHRMALTGTPVENRLLDLWSIFNFLNPGYLGTQGQFRKQFELPIQKDSNPTQSALLKKLVQPFILRRVKTDKAIIRDLPEKVEHKQYCNLTREQASLYEAVVKEVEKDLEAAAGMKRKGLILATLLRLKQICNHPRQFLQDASPFTPERSHKLERLSEMLEEVIGAGESLLIFSQFTEIAEALEKHLRALHYPTYYLHGGTPRARREQMISAFQDPDSGPAAFILSLKAGGVGITLTKDNHVFHFDRWWNPAVEDQATDRAFRIGQTRNVFVHKFVTLGTLEERIDQMLEDKKQVAGLVVGSDEAWLTELDNASFKRLIALNRSAVLD